MIDKQESRRIWAQIRRVLVDVWNPIGTKDAFVPQDEYDCCLGSLFHLLTTGATDDEIADYLWRQGTEPMGLDLRKENTYPAVAALREIPPAESVTV